MLNVVTGGESIEQRAFGDFLEKQDRYARMRRVPRHRPPAVDLRFPGDRDR